MRQNKLKKNAWLLEQVLKSKYHFYEVLEGISLYRLRNGPYSRFQGGNRILNRYIGSKREASYIFDNIKYICKNSYF